MMIEPCICGHKPIVYKDGETYVVHCNIYACNNFISIFSYEEDLAIKSWNTFIKEKRDGA